MSSQLEDAFGAPYRRLTEEERDSPPEPYDQARAARLVVFATDVLRDLDGIRKHAERILRNALSLFHQEDDRRLRQPGEYDAYLWGAKNLVPPANS